MLDLHLIVLTLILGALVLLLLQSARIAGLLLRLEISLQSERDGSEKLHINTDAAGGAGESGGLFQEFLSEDPERGKLPKSEQFAAFRQWRKDKGLSWSG